MPERTWHTTGHCTLGYANHDKPEVSISLRGPRSGDLGGGCMTPTEARELAQELNDAANFIDPPMQLPEHHLYFRGYEIQPLNADGITCRWINASSFRIHPPHPDRPALDDTPQNLNAARDAVIEDIENG
jgi:hypothetical protein